MKKFSFHQKVFLAIVLTSLLVLALVLLPLWLTNHQQYKNQLLHHSEAQAKTLASISAASLMFEQQEAALSLLSALTEQPDVISACLYRLDDSSQRLIPFASYGPANPKPLETAPVLGAVFSEQWLSYTAAVQQDGLTVGYLQLTISMQELEHQFHQLQWALSLALLLAGALASWLALLASRSALQPLQELKAVTGSIAQTKDYSRRADPLLDRDLTDFILSFNSMLDVIERMNKVQKEKELEITELNKTLEQKVEQRTSELRHSVTELDRTLQHLKTTQTKLIEQEKLASLGSLVAGVAHEINTPVGVAVTAVTHLTYLTDRLTQTAMQGQLSKSAFMQITQDIHESAAVILKNLDRAADQIRSFKMVAIDQSSEEARRFHLLEYLQSIVLSLRPKLKQTKHQIRLDVDTDLQIYSFPGVFSQIMTNLIMNSLIHGFSGIDAGEITIQATKTDGYLHLNYYDNGKGIPADIKPKIWDPFVTSNRQGGGSGLGTYILYNLVTQALNGRIDLVDDVQAGVHFAILVPLVEAPVTQKLPHNDA